MRKTWTTLLMLLTATATATATAGAWAQSGVSISGILDIGPRMDFGSTAGTLKSIQSGQQYGSRLDFIGVEDLGDRWKAGFVLEAGMTLDDGAGSANPPGASGFNFGRTAAVSLGSDRTGYVSMGRQYDPIWAVSASGSNDPFVGSWLGGNSVVYTQSVISSNSIVYSYGYGERTMLLAAPRQGLGFAAMYAFGEATSNAGQQLGFNVSYGFGPWFFGYAFHQVNGSSATESVTAPVSTSPRLRYQTFSTAYDFGVLRVHAGFNTGRNSIGTLNRRNWTLGTTIPVLSNQSVRILYGNADDETSVNADWKALQLGYYYEFSKRTAWYTGFGMVKNNGNANATLGRQIGTYAKGSTPKALITGIRTIF